MISKKKDPRAANNDHAGEILLRSDPSIQSHDLQWMTVNKDHSCPICGKPDWCGISQDGVYAICMRVKSNKTTRNGGWLHKLKDGGARNHPYTRNVVLRTSPVFDFVELALQYERAVTDSMINRHTSVLGISKSAVRRLHMGWDGDAWTFPMTDCDGHVTGIRRRFNDGRKLAVKGGRDGLFIPDNLCHDSSIIICEGPTDAAAMLTLGLDAIGRPSCRGGVDLLKTYCRGRKVVILADGDKPGRDGAWALCKALKLVCPEVRVICPPSGIKDARAWLQAGATKTDVQSAINSAEPVRLKVRCI